MKVDNWCKTHQNFCKQIQSTPKIIIDPFKHLGGPTEFFKEHKFSPPIFLYSSFFLARKSSSKIFSTNFFKQLNLFSRFFCIGVFFSRIFLNRYRFPAKKMPLVQSCREKNRVGEKHS